jgi:hypothetical protein
MESCGPGTEIIEPTLAFFQDQRSAPSLSSRRTLIQLLTQKKNNFTDELEHFSGRFRAAVTHLQSFTTGLCPGIQQLTYFRRLSTNSLVALNSVCVKVSKIRPFLRTNKVLL